MNSVPHVPLETAEYNRLVIRVWDLTSIEFNSLESIALLQFKSVFFVVLALAAFSLLESMSQRVEVDLGVWKDAELLAAPRVEYGLAEQVVLER